MSLAVSMVDRIAVDGQLGERVKDLLGASSLHDKVVHRTRQNVYGTGVVHEFTVVDDLPAEAWSTGEQLMWQFVCSMVGCGEVNLGQVISYFVRSPYSVDLVHLFAVAMGGIPTVGRRG